VSWRASSWSTTLALALTGCSGSSTSPASAPSEAGTISGTVSGTSWTSLSNAYWIGMPSAGSPPLIVFLFEGPMDCATLTNVNWDKTAIGDKQLLEIGVMQSKAGTFQIPMDASVAYLKGFFNPSAEVGTVTVGQINATQNVTGSFDVTFAGDALKGSFDAKYCAGGVEP
jgi:hypothetical protein